MHWFCFHGNQDFGYLVKQCCFDPLPVELQDFRNLLNTLFPNLTDLKTSLKWEFGLSTLAQYYNVNREGTEHQAGSDALLTLKLAVKVGPTEWEGFVHDL